MPSPGEPSRPTALAPQAVPATSGTWGFAGYVIVAGLAALVLDRVHPWPGPGTPVGPSAPYAYGPFVLIVFVPYALVALSWLRGRAPSRRAWWIGAVLIGVVFVVVPPVQSHDAFQYVAYGRMELIHEANPFLVSPAAFPADPITRLIGWPNAKSVYGPAWLAPMAGIVAVADGSIRTATTLVKGFVWALVLATGWAIERSVSGVGDDRAEVRGRVAAFLFVCNPIVISGEALGGHADACIALAFAAAVLADRRGRERWAALALALAVLVKVWAVLPFGVYVILRARRNGVRWLPGLVAGPVALVVAGYAPFWVGPRTLEPLAVGLRTSSSVAGIVQGALDRLLRAADVVARPEVVAAGAVRVASIALLATLAAMLVSKKRTSPDVWVAVALAVGGFMLATPWYLPWYAIAPLALGLCLGGGPAAGALTLSCTSSFSVPLAAGGAILRFASPMVAWHRARTRTRAAPASSGPTVIADGAVPGVGPAITALGQAGAG